MTAPSARVTALLAQLGLPPAAEECVPRLTQAGHAEALPTLLEVFESDAEACRQRRVARLRGIETLDTGRLPRPVARQLEALAGGAFLETATNVLAVRLAGRGQEPCACAVGHALVEAGDSVRAPRPYAMVQELWGDARPRPAPRPAQA